MKPEKDPTPKGWLDQWARWNVLVGKLL